MDRRAAFHAENSGSIPDEVTNMRKYENIQKEVKTTVDIICDCCKQTCKRSQSTSTDREPEFEFATLDTNWGYWSDRDGEYRIFHICEACYVKFLEFFNITDDSGSDTP